MSKILSEKIFVFCIWATLLLALPFVYVQYSIDPEFAPRFMVIAVLCGISSLYFVFAKRSLLRTFNFLRNPVVIVAFSRLAWEAISAFKAINEGEALLTLMLHFLFFYILILTSWLLLNTSRSFLYMICGSAVSLLVFSCFAIIQLKTKLSEHNWRILFEESDQFLTSTLANKNFYAETILMIIPFLTIGIFSLKKTMKKIFIALLLVALFSLIFLQTISTWLALLAGILCFAFLITAKRHLSLTIPFKRITIVTGGLVLILSILIYSLWNLDADGLKMLAGKWESIRSTGQMKVDVNATSGANDNSVYERLLLWRNTWKLIQDHPVTGAGLANWKIEEAQYGIGGSHFINSGFVHYEHPHNEFLLIWSETGSIGMLLLLIQFLVLFRLAFIILRRSENAHDRVVSILCVSGIVAFAVLSFFSYPMSRIFSMIFFTLTMATMIAVYERTIKNRSDYSFPVALRLFFTFSFVVGCAASFAAWQRLQGETHLHDALTCKYYRDWNCMFTLTQQANVFFFPVDLSGTPIEWYAGMSFVYQNKSDSAVKYLKHALKKNPFHILVLNDLGSAFLQAGKNDSAIECFQRALDITPQFGTAQINLASAYYNNHQIGQAFDTIRGMRDTSFFVTQEYGNALSEILYTRSYLTLSQLRPAEDTAWKAEIAKPELLRELFEKSQLEKIPLDTLLISFFRTKT